MMFNPLRKSVMPFMLAALLCCSFSVLAASKSADEASAAVNQVLDGLHEGRQPSQFR